jgi:cell division septal protein FtsQ
MKRQKINPAIKLLVSVIIVFAIFSSVAAVLWHNFKRLDYFKIKEIAASENNAVDLSYLKGENIFSVNLEKQARYLSQLYPVYKKIRLVRILPDRIYVDFIKRKPLAYVKLYKYFLADEESVLFDVPDQEQAADLPVILGLETKIFGPRSGKKFNVKELTLALTMIKEMQNNRILRFCKIKKIDVAHPANTSVFIELPMKNHGFLGQQALALEPIEVKIGQRDVQDKIDILANLFIQLKKDWFNIKYIDLRFNEPVVKFKDDKDAKTKK